MRRQWQIWTVFLAFLAIVMIAMAWITMTVLHLQRENLETQRQAMIEESVRLALWRMDAAISPLILEESARPYFDYWASVDDSRNQREKKERSWDTNTIQVASSPDVNLYFNAFLTKDEKNPAITSPQVSSTEPHGQESLKGKDAEEARRNKKQLEVLNDNISVEKLQRALDQAQQVEQASTVSGDTLNNDQAVLSLRENNDAANNAPAQPQASGSSLTAQGRRSGWGEYSQRQSQSVQTKSKLLASKNRLYDAQNAAQEIPAETYKNPSGGAKQPSAKPVTGKKSNARAASGKLSAPATLVKEDVMRPVWSGNFLLLARKVNVDGQNVIQGVWLNWDNIRKKLLDSVRDLFPQANLVQADPASEAGKAHLLAYLPARFVPGTPASLPAISESPLKLPLIVAWMFVGLAVLAFAALLFGTTSLSERRAAFVSAVTHELRTPLTTFRMYSEMLVENMIKDETKKKHYLDTLYKESNRLGHLVENVLAYARLERGAGGRTMESVSVGAILDRAIDPLMRRALEAGMELVIDVSDENRCMQSRTDLMAVEQILFNLVDNACKYAVSAADHRIHLAVTSSSRHLVFRVCDHGPGLKKHEQRIVFKPFRKSAEKAAQTAPGVGLGLALCKRLVRQLGGDIFYEEHAGYGACFTVHLPRS